MTLTALPSHPFLATSEPAIDLFPMSAECTVSQAAEFLDMSEGCVEELLDGNVIEYRQIGEERLVQRDSLQEFESRYRRRLNTTAQ